MSIGLGEMLVVGVTGALGLAFQVAPLVLLIVLWKRNTRLQARVEALEKRIADGG